MGGVVSQSGCVSPEGEGWNPPSLDYDFCWVGGFIPGVDWVNKPFVQSIIAFVMILVFWLIASRKLRTVPNKFQFFTEGLYNFVRNSISRDMLGPEQFRRYTPYLLALFCFILVNNLFGLFPGLNYPTFANIGFAWGLALLSWVIYNVAGFATHGIKYLKYQTAPSGVPLALLPLLIPIEFISNIVVRPVTLALRLFGTMVAGHALVLVFVVGGTHLLLNGDGILLRASGVLTLGATFAIFALELLIMSLQAYIFTLLTAVYVASATSSDH